VCARACVRVCGVCACVRACVCVVCVWCVCVCVQYEDFVNTAAVYRVKPDSCRFFKSDFDFFILKTCNYERPSGRILLEINKHIV